jgi:hypothetical protein
LIQVGRDQSVQVVELLEGHVEEQLKAIGVLPQLLVVFNACGWGNYLASNPTGAFATLFYYLAKYSSAF